jgi:hypothetical protein
MDAQGQGRVYRELLGPAHKEFFSVTVEIPLPEGRGIRRVEELFGVTQLELDEIGSSSDFPHRRSRQP